MKQFFFVPALILLIILKGYSQDLTGEWSGKMITTGTYYEQRIHFVFSKINDTTYRAYSISFLPRDKDSAVCLMQGAFWKDQVIYLEEKKVLKYFHGDSTSSCLQYMKLTFRKKKKETILKGDWFTEDNTCGYGTIWLTKRED